MDPFFLFLVWSVYSDIDPLFCNINENEYYFSSMHDQSLHVEVMYCQELVGP